MGILEDLHKFHEGKKHIEEDGPFIRQSSILNEFRNNEDFEIEESDEILIKSEKKPKKKKSRQYIDYLGNAKEKFNSMEKKGV